MLTAITRKVSPCIDQCELTFVKRQPIDVAKAARQQQAYEQALNDLGVRVISLGAESEMPDAVFVEDTAVVVNEMAVICPMGSAKRRPEIRQIIDTVSAHRPLRFLTGSAALDGGDVVSVGRTLYVGHSTRTNLEGIAQLRDILKGHRYDVKAVEVKGCLHLSTGCSYLGDDRILANGSWIDAGAFEGLTIIEAPAEEPWGANTLLVGDTIFVPASCPRTRDKLEQMGYDARALDISELEKAEGGLTCLSLIFDTEAGQ